MKKEKGLNMKSKFMSAVFAFAVVAAACIALPSVAGAVYEPNKTYANPSTQQTNNNRGTFCSDPWVTMALDIVYGDMDRQKSRCTVSLYNGGQWNNFNQLVHAVGKKRLANLPKLDLSRTKYLCTTTPKSCTIYSGNLIKVGKVENGNFTVELDTNFKASIVAAGAGNMVAAGGGNLIGLDGASIVAAGAGNVITKNVEAAPTGPKSGYALQGVNSFSALKAKTMK